MNQYAQPVVAGMVNQQQLILEYQYELDRLREENQQIRLTVDLRNRDFENVMFENA